MCGLRVRLSQGPTFRAQDKTETRPKAQIQGPYTGSLDCLPSCYESVWRGGVWGPVVHAL